MKQHDISEVIKTAGIVVWNKKQEVLLVCHNESADHHTGVYGIPAGKIEAQEQPIEAAVRECFEETGLIIPVHTITSIPKVYTATIEKKDGTKKQYELVVFVSSFYTGELRQTAETRPEWVAIDQLSTKTLLPNVADIIHIAHMYTKHI